MQDTIFTKIINGEIPCHKIYEDAKTIAFMDIHPLVKGHVLVVPRVQIDNFEELSDEDYQALFSTVKTIAKRVKQVFESQRACIRVEGFDVPHAHVHVYPCNSPDDFYGDKDRFSKEPNHSALAEVAAKLTSPN